jgi:hypothetical protein
MAAVVAGISSFMLLPTAVMAADGSSLAVAGDLKVSNGELGFTTVPQLFDAGVWATLLITVDQAKELNQAWEATIGAAPPLSDGLTPEKSAERSRALKDFKGMLEAILTEDQKDVRARLNKELQEAVHEHRKTSGGSSGGADHPESRAVMYEKLPEIISPEAMKNFNTYMGQAPTGLE